MMKVKKRIRMKVVKLCVSIILLGIVIDIYSCNDCTAQKIRFSRNSNLDLRNTGFEIPGMGKIRYNPKRKEADDIASWIEFIPDVLTLTDEEHKLYSALLARQSSFNSKLFSNGTSGWYPDRKPWDGKSVRYHHNWEKGSPTFTDDFTLLDIPNLKPKWVKVWNTMAYKLWKTSLIQRQFWLENSKIRNNEAGEFFENVKMREKFVITKEKYEKIDRWFQVRPGVEDMKPGIFERTPMATPAPF